MCNLSVGNFYNFGWLNRSHPVDELVERPIANSANVVIKNMHRGAAHIPDSIQARPFPFKPLADTRQRYG